MRVLPSSPSLDRATELSLLADYRRTGDRRAEERLVCAQLGLVHQLARGHHAAGLDFEDLVQEGALGLLQAIRRFDAAHGVRLSTYAAWWIRAYQYRFMLHNHRLVRMGTTQAQRRLFFRLRTLRARLTAAGIEATPERIGALLGVDAREVRALEPRLDMHDLSLNEPASANDRGRPWEPCAGEPPADETAWTRERDVIVRYERDRFRAGLDARRRALFDARWLGDEAPTLEEMGARFGVTRERARQLEQGMLSTLRERLRARLAN
jgi:RNA polymerase sigma-32 factor